MRSYWSRVGLSSNMTGVLTEKGRFRHRNTQGESTMQTGSRDHGDAHISQGTPKITSKPPRARTGARGRFFTALRRNQTGRHLDLGPLASRTVRNTFLLCESPSLVFC